MKEEIKAEQASVQAARVIEKQRREISLNRDLDNLRQSQDDVNQRVDTIVTAISQLPKVHIDISGKRFGKIKTSLDIVLVSPWSSKQACLVHLINRVWRL